MQTIFALDSSGKTASVCVLKDGDVVYERLLDQGLTHSETLLPLVQDGFRSSGLTPEQVGLFAVTAGPGSFTGLRIGLSLVKGLALPWDTLVAPVSTLYALSLTVPEFDGIVLAALDARRKEAYWAAFDGTDKHRRLHQDTAGPVSGIGDYIGRQGRDIIYVGDGAEMCYNMINYKFQRCSTEPPQRSIAWGTAMAALEMQREGEVLPSREIQPEYLRLSQAQRERQQAAEKEKSGQGGA